MAVSRNQFRAALIMEITIVIVMILISFSFWRDSCNHKDGCFSIEGDFASAKFLLLSVIRPFLFTPTIFMAMVAGTNFGPFTGTLLNAFAQTISCLVLYLPTKYLGRRYIKPWFLTHLPITFKLLQTQDYKICFISRWIPLIPFDFLSLLFGVLDFRIHMVIVATFFGILPESWFFAQVASSAGSAQISEILSDLFIFGAITGVPLVVYEYKNRKKGNSLWRRAQRTYLEIVYEASINHMRNKTEHLDPSKTPILLLYGFFSSRRTMTQLERNLRKGGYDVLTFNLGGLLGIFFTKSVAEAAATLAMKSRRQMRKHGIKKFHVVAHSKGGLVALWWLIKLQGHKHCDKLVTLGSPFRGSYLVYFGLITPLAFFFKDLWEMRPGSRFLKELRLDTLPENLELYCFYSNSDRVTRGNSGLMQFAEKQKNLHPIPLHHLAHFEFLYRPEVANLILNILKSGPKPPSSD